MCNINAEQQSLKFTSECLYTFIFLEVIKCLLKNYCNKNCLKIENKNLQKNKKTRKQEKENSFHQVLCIKLQIKHEKEELSVSKA